MALVLGNAPPAANIVVVLLDAKGKQVASFSLSPATSFQQMLPKTVQVKSIAVTPVVS